jgi:tetratricopeptide (TPR) repeat protein
MAALKQLFVGFEEQPIPSFLEAVEVLGNDSDGPLAKVVDGAFVTYRKAEDAKLFGRLQGNPLPVDGIACLMEYLASSTTPTLFQDLSARCSENDQSKVAPYAKFLWLLQQSLNILEPYSGDTVFRGSLEELLGHFPVEAEIVWPGPSSAAKTMDSLVAEGRGFLRTIFALRLTQRQARDISAYSPGGDGHEVVLPPGSRFRVESVRVQGGLSIIQLVELPSRDWILDLNPNPAPAGGEKGHGEGQTKVAPAESFADAYCPRSGGVVAFMPTGTGTTSAAKGSPGALPLASQAPPSQPPTSGGGPAATVPQDSQQALQVHTERGIAMSKFGDNNGALRCYKTALQIHEQFGTLQTAQGAKLLRRMGAARLNLGDGAGALADFQQALQTNEALGSSGALVGEDAVLERLLGAAKVALGDHAGAMTHFNRALQLHEQRGTLNTHHGVELEQRLGTSKAAMGDNEGALACYHHARQLHEKLGTLHSQQGAELHLLIGTVKMNLNDHGRALQYLKQAQQIYDITGAPKAQDAALLQRRLGSASAAVGDHGAALQHFQQAVQLQEMTGGLQNQQGAVLLQRMGSSKLHLGDFSGALQIYRRAEQAHHATETLQTPQSALLQGEIGTVLAKLGDVEGASQHFSQARGIHERCGTLSSPQGQALLDAMRVAGLPTA